MSSKRIIQLVSVLAGLGLLACSPVEPRDRDAGPAFDPWIEVAEDTTVLSEAQRQRGLQAPDRGTSGRQGRWEAKSLR